MKMCSRGLLLSVTLLGLIAGGISELIDPLPDPVPTGSCWTPSTSTVVPGPKCDYMMMVPFKLTSGSQGTVCTWLKCEVPVTITVYLEYSSEELPIVSKPDTSDHYDCTEFTVPDVGEETSVFFSFSATGDNVNVADRKPAVIDVPLSACLGQKDKKVYMPGEPIQLRIPCYNQDLKPVSRNFTEARLIDPTGARVNQILNPTIEHGVVNINFMTSERSRTGLWTIQLLDDTGKTENTYAELQRYELQRFVWNANCPSSVSVLDKTAEITGTAEYVYGEPVPGTVVVRCCRTVPKYGRKANCFRGINDICYEFTKELDENGKLSEFLDLGQFQLPFSGLSNYLTCDITMKETGTGVLVPSSCYMSITDQLAVLTLDRTSMGISYNKVYQPVVATLTDEKGQPLPSRTITVQIDGTNVKCLTTDANGRVEDVIDTSSYKKPNITLTVFYQDDDLCYNEAEYSNYYTNYARSYPSDEMMLFRYFSKSQSHIRLRPLQGQLPCYKSYSIQVDYSFTEEGVGKGATTTTIKYIFMSRNRIAAGGEVPVDLSGSYKGSVSIKFDVDSKFATGATLLAFVTLKEDIISDTASLNIGTCFENEVNMEFTEAVVEPGATVVRKITAGPGSFCGLLARDVAFNLLNSYDEFNPNNVYNQVQSYIFGLQYNGVNYEDPPPPCIDGNTEQFYNGGYVKSTSCNTDSETQQDLTNLNLLVASNLDTTRPRVCGLEDELYSSPFQPLFSLAEEGFVRKSGSFVEEGGPVADSINTVRSDLSDTFGDDTVIIGPDGEATVSSIISQRITDWVSDGFCFSADKGLGLTNKPAKITTKQPFFVETSIPSYVIRGEEVIASIAISNYLPKNAQVEIEVDDSDDYQVTLLNEKVQQCVGSQQKVFWKAAFAFSRIGNIKIGITARTTKISDTCDGPNDDSQPSRSDKIILTVNSEAEGINKQESSSHLLIVSDSTAAVDISVAPPDNVVPDSFTLTVKIMGDTVALATENYDRLLSTPSGCCDQLQGTLLSLIFLAKYLVGIEELSNESDQSKKLVAKLSTGYMDMITCQRYDGGFCRYPGSYEITSWGSLLALRTMFHLEEYIYIDEHISTQTLISISRTQDLESGCLKPEGYWSIYQENFDATTQYNALAAFILQEISLKYSAAGPILEGVKRCLENVDIENQNTLTQSYLFIAAAVAGDWDKWQILFDILNAKAINDGNFIYWRNENVKKLVIYQYYPTTSTGDVSITSNIMIGMAKYPNPSEELLDNMGSTATWLSGQITANGGSYASQPTSSTFEALTLFGGLVNTKKTDAVVSIVQNGVEVFNVAINKQNKFIIQSKEISSPFAEYKCTATGTGSVFFQLVATYNIMIGKGEDAAFDVNVQAKESDCVSGVAKKVDLVISVSYKGERAECGDTIVSVGILSGFWADLYSGIKPSNVEDSRIDNNKARFYLSSVTSNATEITLPTYLQNRVTTYQMVYVVVEEIVTGETGGVGYKYPCDSDQ